MVARMRKSLALHIDKYKIATVICLAAICLSGCAGESIGMLNPKGIIAFAERKLFFDTLALMLVVVLPVIIMSLTFVYHYRQSNRSSDYKPDWSHSVFLEVLWWGIPIVIIIILAVMTWKESHNLDPYRRIGASDEKPMLIQAIALPWKWLFIYPEENIATVNYLEIPIGQEIELWMTTDNVPMSAFFIPQLGSQIYAMAGMRTRLHLQASSIGVLDGLNTQYNGDGFAGMHFPVHIVEANEMKEWVAKVKQTGQPLSEDAYRSLLNESVDNQAAFYSNIKPDLFDEVIAIYMDSTGTEHPRSNQLKMNYSIF